MLSLQKYGDAAMVVLRLVIGAIFIGHGMQKFGSWEQPAQGMNVVMMILSIAEPLGGAALILGALTQWAAMGLSLVMLGAIYLKQFAWGGAFINSDGPAWELDAAILGGLLVLVAYGAGRLSVDAMLRKA